MLTNILLTVLALLNTGLLIFIIQLLKPKIVKSAKNYSFIAGCKLDLDEFEKEIS